jgi:nucleoside-diphosphate-sugar epimerase
MNILFIGGTGNISSACLWLARNLGHEVSALTRGHSEQRLPPGVSAIVAYIADADAMRQASRDKRFDVVVNFIAFQPEDVERDIALFQGKIRQYIFISSASCYQKPPSHPLITESTPLANPFWDYSRQKIACEERLLRAYREEGFPITIVRPSLTYQYVIPLVFGAWKEYTLVDRMKRGQPVIVHGDGTSLWTITHAEDFAKGFCGLLGHQQAIGHAFHITSEEILTWNQIYQAVAAAVGVEADIVHIPSDFIARHLPQKAGTLLGDKAHSAVFDNGKIKTFVPGFQAVIPFAEGIRRTLEWFHAEPARMVVDPRSNDIIDALIARYRRAYD